MNLNDGFNSILNIEDYDFPDQFFRFTKEYTYKKDYINKRVLKRITGNAYRILDLPLGATEDEILQKGESIKRKIRLGIKESRIFAINSIDDMEIDERLVIAAIDKLLNPESRLTEQLFCFFHSTDWPPEEHVSRNMTLREFIELFCKIGQFTGIIKIETLFRLSLLGLILLILDDYYLESRKSWTSIYNLLLTVVKSEDFLKMLDGIERRGYFAKKIDCEKEDLQDNNIEKLYMEPLQVLIEEHIDNNRLNSIRGGLAILAEINISPGLRGDLISDILYRLEDEVTGTGRSIIADCNERIVRDEKNLSTNKDMCNFALNLYNDKILPKYRLLLDHSADYAQIDRIKDGLAEFYYRLAVLFTWGNDFVMAYELLLEAEDITKEDSGLKNKIGKLLEDIRPTFEQQKILNANAKKKASGQKERTNTKKNDRTEQRKANNKNRGPKHTPGNKKQAILPWILLAIAAVMVFHILFNGPGTRGKHSDALDRDELYADSGKVMPIHWAVQ